VRLMNHELDTVRENMKAAALLIAAQRDELDALKAGR
jgi:hypothetical protein